VYPADRAGVVQPPKPPGEPPDRPVRGGERDRDEGEREPQRPGRAGLLFPTAASRSRRAFVCSRNTSSW
jgi:hypothetical protein